MVFCFGGAWNKFACPYDPTTDQEIMRSAYLKTYETVVSEDESD
jgi:hypothetical protein